MFKLGINFDEISDSLDLAIATMKRNNVYYGELRTLNGRNFCFWSGKDTEQVNRQLIEESIVPIAVASPIFKWYVAEEDPEVPHDSFGFNARLSDDEKKSVIDTVLHNAVALKIPIVRIFSGLGKRENAVDTFLADPILSYALDLASELSIDLCIENEPVCNIYTKRQLIDLFSRKLHPRLKLWLDIANLLQLGEAVDDELLGVVGDRLAYIHVKDYINTETGRKYVPVGDGEIEYPAILARILSYVSDDIFVTIETHAPGDLKQAYSEQSITATKNIIRSLR